MRGRDALPRFVRDYVLHFEAEIESAVRAFSAALEGSARVLDAGAGEGQYKHMFDGRRYVGVDLGIGDAAWNYSSLDTLADLEHLPFGSGYFDAAINIVTLEHVRRPQAVLEEIVRVLRPHGLLLLITPHEWEEHQQPHDYFRFTRYGIEHLVRSAGCEVLELRPVGGYFRLLARRLLNGLQFFPGVVKVPAALFLAPPAMVLPLLDRFDKQRNFTLGHICIARKL